MVSSEDRIAPDCTIRHPVCPIVALQRRMRFSTQLAGFCMGRWHQRRARRADLASFSVFVSNRDFRVPRLRQRGERAADRAVQRRKRGRPRGPESRPGLPRRSRASTFWSRCGPGLDPGLRPGAWHYPTGVPWCTTPIEPESSLGPDSHHPIISLSGIPSAVMVLRILRPILASTLCAANPLARIAEPTIAL